ALDGEIWCTVRDTLFRYDTDTDSLCFYRKLDVASVMLIGYTIIAVPTGIVSVSLMKRHEKNVARECPNCHRRGHEESAQFCKYCGSSLGTASFMP
ncbi:hypothetical protein PZH42_29670, partial [Bacteroides cellulosilyticus]|nr:hypothetical protein [Bacteroides cellulosilyticus]